MKDLKEKITFSPTEKQVSKKDFTELLEKYRILEQQHSQLTVFRSLIEITHIGLFIFQNGALVYKNSWCEKILSATDITPQETSSGNGNTGLKTFEEEIYFLAMTSKLANREFYLLKDDERFWISLMADAVEYNGFPAIACILLDITNQKIAEDERERYLEQIFRHQKMESLHALARGVAHDFNNILSTILGTNSLIKAEYQRPSQSGQLLDNIENCTRKGIELVQNLLAFSQTEKVPKKVFNLNRIIEKAIATFKNNVPLNIMIHHQLSPELLAVDGNIQQIQQVILILALNSVEAIRYEKGIVTITSGKIDINEAFRRHFKGFLVPKIGSYVFFEVHDTGCGMDKNQIQRMFEPYYTTKEPGRGLNLSIAYNFVKNNDGFFEVESHPERGTSIRIYLPEAKTHPFSDDELLSRLLTDVNTILLADDEEIVQITIKKILQKLNYSVLTADDGEQALQIYKKMHEQIDLVLLDLSMPILNGEQVLEEIHKMNPEAKVILFSGYDEVEASRRIKSTGGVAGFIEKPSLIDELGKRITKLFSRKEQI
ncbi:response regulator [candidate division KSB1 bacterium]|nr:response regulator [candidate division KSB1 bacterium]